LREARYPDRGQSSRGGCSDLRQGIFDQVAHGARWGRILQARSTHRSTQLYCPPSPGMRRLGMR
jgi:hypothetical protein